MSLTGWMPKIIVIKDKEEEKYSKLVEEAAKKIIEYYKMNLPMRYLLLPPGKSINYLKENPEEIELQTTDIKYIKERVRVWFSSDKWNTPLNCPHYLTDITYVFEKLEIKPGLEAKLADEKTLGEEKKVSEEKAEATPEKTTFHSPRTARL